MIEKTYTEGEMQAMIGAVIYVSEDALMDAVWNALKADANDLRKQQRILRAFRSLRSDATDALAALERVRQEARNAAMEEAREAVRTVDPAAGDSFDDGLEQAIFAIDALKDPPTGE